MLPFPHSPITSCLPIVFCFYQFRHYSLPTTCRPQQGHSHSVLYQRASSHVPPLSSPTSQITTAVLQATNPSTMPLPSRTPSGGFKTKEGTLYVSKPFRSSTSHKLKAMIAFTPRKSHFDIGNESSGANEFRVSPLLIISVFAFGLVSSMSGDRLPLGDPGSLSSRRGTQAGRVGIPAPQMDTPSTLAAKTRFTLFINGALRKPTPRRHHYTLYPPTHFSRLATREPPPKSPHFQFLFHLFILSTLAHMRALDAGLRRPQSRLHYTQQSSRIPIPDGSYGVCGLGCCVPFRCH